MKLSRRQTSIVLVLCLLVLQAQVWASAMLGCRHEAGLDARQMASCHHQAPDRMNSGTPNLKLLDCYKCALHCLVTVPVPMAYQPAMLAQTGPQALVPASGLHFYHFIPALPERPPRV